MTTQFKKKFYTQNCIQYAKIANKFMKYTKMNLLFTLRLKYVSVIQTAYNHFLYVCIVLFSFFAEKETVVFMMTKLHDGKKYACKTNCNMCS